MLALAVACVDLWHWARDRENMGNLQGTLGRALSVPG